MSHREGISAREGMTEIFYDGFYTEDRGRYRGFPTRFSTASPNSNLVAALAEARRIRFVRKY